MALQGFQSSPWQYASGDEDKKTAAGGGAHGALASVAAGGLERDFNLQPAFAPVYPSPSPSSFLASLRLRELAVSSFSAALRGDTFNLAAAKEKCLAK